jgi:septal ring factor EnvC (AmiA/AmiB activator)
VAVCARRPQVGNPTFVYVPRAANVLRERERHIAKLEKELATKDEWLDKAQKDLAEFDREHQKLLAMFREQKEDLERSNRWAEELNAELAERRARVAELQEEMVREQEKARQMAERYNAKIGALEKENQEMAQWAKDTETRLTEELRKAIEAFEHTEKELQARTEWALSLDKEKGALEDQLTLVRASRWVRLGRKVGVGPAL